MHLKSIEINNCRNIEHALLQTDKGLTVIAGQNGEGKTNLLECIWLLTGSKSFRGSKDMQLVRQDEEFGRISGSVYLQNGSEKNIDIQVCGPACAKKGRFAKVNGVDYGRAAAIAGIFTAVIFEPDHLSLVKGSPEGRRRFIDAAMCQLYPKYILNLRRFQRALSQKNALLKNYYKTPDADLLLDSFDEELSLSGEEISRRRSEYLEKLIPIAEEHYFQISNTKEKMELSYTPCCQNGNLKALLLEKRQNDVRAGFSTFGPQREDLIIDINEKSAKNYGSQGQQRSAVLAIKLAEAACAEEISGQSPIMLLDDVLSELDETRQSYLLNRMQANQCFVTACDPAVFKRTAGNIVKIRGGKII